MITNLLSLFKGKSVQEVDEQGNGSKYYPLSTLKRWIAVDASGGSKDAHDIVATDFDLPYISDELFTKEVQQAVERLSEASPLMGLVSFYAGHISYLWVKAQRQIYNTVLEEGRKQEIDLTPEIYDTAYRRLMPNFLFNMILSMFSATVAMDAIHLAPGLVGTGRMETE